MKLRKILLILAISIFVLAVLACIIYAISPLIVVAYDYISHTLFFTSNTFNFIIVVAFFVWLLFGKLDFVGVLENKRKEITEYINNSESKKANAIKYFAETKESLKNIDYETQKIISDAKAIAESIEDKTKNKIEEELAGLENRVKILKEAHESKIKEEISQKIANAAILVSKEYIENSLNEGTHKELIYSFIDNLENMKVE